MGAFQAGKRRILGGGKLSLEERVKALENWRDNIIAAFIGAPPMQPRHIVAEASSAFKTETSANINVQANGWIVTNEYIRDHDLWARINADLTAHGYRWVSAGKSSHWEK